MLSPLPGIYFYKPCLPGTYFVIESCLSPLPAIYFYTPYLPSTYFVVESCLGNLVPRAIFKK